MVSKAPLVVRVTEVSQELLDQLVQPDYRAWLDRLALLAVQEPKVQLAQWVSLEFLELRVPLDILVRPETLASKARQDSRDSRDCRVTQELLETLVHLVDWDQLAAVDSRVRKDRLEHRDRLDTLVTLDHRAARDRLDLRDRRASPELQVLLDHLVAVDRRELLVSRVLQEVLEPRDSLEHQEIEELLEQPVLKGRLELPDLGEVQDRPDSRVTQELQEQLVVLVSLVQQGQLDTQEIKVSLGHREPQDSLVPREAKDRWAYKVLRDTLDHLE